MYKNLNTAALGISGRQSELIELALTYGFKGLNLDMGEIVKRVRVRGIDSARRFLESANMCVGEFDLPINWEAEETAFRSSLVELKEIAEIASALGGSNCAATVKPISESLPYHENFELHRARFAEIGDILAAHNIKLGLTFLAAAYHRDGDSSPFIHQAETLLTLIKTIGNSNVGLVLDTWNWTVGGGAMDQLSDMPCEQIVSVRLADIRTDADLATIRDEDRCLPGDGGLVDCVAIVRHLIEHNYEGPCSIQPHPARFTGMTRDAIVQKASVRFDTIRKSAETSPAEELESVPVETK